MSKRRAFILVFCLGFPLLAIADGLKSTFTKSTIQLGERTRVEFHLPISALGLAKYDDESELPVLNDDLILDAKNLIVLERDFTRERDTLIWRFDLTSYQKGKLIVPPVEIRFGPYTFSSEGIPLEVISGRKPEDRELRPDHGEVPYPIHWALWGRLFALVALAGVIYYLHRKHPDWRQRLRLARGRWLGPKASEEPAESWLKRELIRLRARLSESGSEKIPLVDDFTNVLKGFFRRKTQRPAESWTTRELKTKLPPGTLPAEVEPLLVKADGWKFGARPADPKAEIVEPGITTSERALL